MPTSNATSVALKIRRLGDSDPSREAEAYSGSVENEQFSVVGLDTAHHDPKEAVRWVQDFHRAWLNRSQGDLGYGTAAPPLVVLLKAGRLEDVSSDLERELAAAGAIIYEKPFPEPPDLQGWFERELRDTVSFLETNDDVRPEDSMDDLIATGAETDRLIEYTDPVYKLQDQDFEQLLDRGRQSDPLRTGD